MEQPARERLLLPQSEPALRQLLIAAGLPVDQWGGDATKTVGQLLTELQSGEATLKQDQQGRLVRFVTGVWLDVFGIDPDGRRYRLREDRQVFTDGSVRERKLTTSLGEKLLPGEGAEDAARRAVAEELGLPDSGAPVLVGVEEAERDSASYPGLRSHHLAFKMVVELAPWAFRPEGYTERQPDKATHFVWEPADQ